MKEARVHAGDQAAICMQGDAGQALGRGPAGQLAVGPAQAAQGPTFDVHPVQRLFGDRPQRALAHLVLVVGQQQFHGAIAHSNGPVRTKGPPW